MKLEDTEFGSEEVDALHREWDRLPLRDTYAVSLFLDKTMALLRRLAGGVTVDDAMVARARDGQEAYWDDDALYVTCERCNGKGHHGGFGEGGHDQDWCETCGGPGSINIGTEVGAMRAALVAALEAK